MNSSDKAVRGWSQIEIQEEKLVVWDGPSEFQAWMKIIYEGGEIFQLLFGARRCTHYIERLGTSLLPGLSDLS